MSQKDTPKLAFKRISKEIILTILLVYIILFIGKIPISKKIIFITFIFILFMALVAFVSYKNKKLIIKHKKSFFKFNLIIGVLLIIFGILDLVLVSYKEIYGYSFLIAGIVTTISYYRTLKKENISN